MTATAGVGNLGEVVAVVVVAEAGLRQPEAERDASPVAEDAVVVPLRTAGRRSSGSTAVGRLRRPAQTKIWPCTDRSTGQTDAAERLSSEGPSQHARMLLSPSADGTGVDGSYRTPGGMVSAPGVEVAGLRWRDGLNDGEKGSRFE